MHCVTADIDSLLVGSPEEWLSDNLPTTTTQVSVVFFSNPKNLNIIVKINKLQHILKTNGTRILSQYLTHFS